MVFGPANQQLSTAHMDQVARFVYPLLAEGEERVAQAIGSALAQFKDQLDAPMTVIYGKVIDPNPTDGTPVSVQLDADGSVVSSYTLATVATGNRVALAVVPPAGQLILGVVGGSGSGGSGGGTGPQGPPGPAGTDGNTVLNGTVNPANTVGVDGDFYINTNTETIFGPKSGGVWGAGTSLVGPQGPSGGSGGTNTILNGTVNPANSVGANGDFYINTNTETIFGPKTAGVWGAGTSLVGPQGATGPQGPAGSGATTYVLLDSFTGANDDAKLNAALSYAQQQTYTPVIKLSPRLYTFTTNGRVPFDGMVIAGPGDGKYSTASGPAGNRTFQINLNFDSSTSGIGWFHSPLNDPNSTTNPPAPQPQVRAVSFIDLAFVDGGGAGHAAFLTQDPGNGNGYQQLLVRNITANGLWGVIGTAANKVLCTACIFDGNWDLNNGWNTAVHVGGSDNSFWDGGQMLMDSPGAGDSVPHEPAGVGVPHIRFNGLDKTVVGRIYCTADGKWLAMRIDGPAYNTGAGTNGGPIVIRGLIAEGRNKGNPCFGALVLITGGQAIFESPWFGFGMSNPPVQGNIVGGALAQGIVHCTGGLHRIYHPTYGNATGVSQTTTYFIYATGGGTTVRARDAAVGSQAGTWADPRPRTHVVGATIDIDNTFVAV